MTHNLGLPIATRSTREMATIMVRVSSSMGKTTDMMANVFVCLPPRPLISHINIAGPSHK